MCKSITVGAGFGAPLQQRQITRVIGQPLANIIPLPRVPRVPLQHISISKGQTSLFNRPSLVDSSILSLAFQSLLPLCYNHILSPNFHFLSELLVFDLSTHPQTATTWSRAQMQSGTRGVASNSATLAGYLSGFPRALGDLGNKMS